MQNFVSRAWLVVPKFKELCSLVHMKNKTHNVCIKYITSIGPWSNPNETGKELCLMIVGWYPKSKTKNEWNNNGTRFSARKIWQFSESLRPKIRATSSNSTMLDFEKVLSHAFYHNESWRISTADPPPPQLYMSADREHYIIIYNVGKTVCPQAKKRAPFKKGT